MQARSTETQVTFRHPFNLSSFDTAQPAGTYRVVTEEERIEGLSFVAYQRVATLLHTPALGTTARHRQTFTIDPIELAAVQAADAAAG